MTMEVKTMIEVSAGEHFTRTSERAQELAKSFGDIVGFMFNSITCVVNDNTNLEYLLRDYHNAHTMEWAQIGPDCVATYSEAVQSELDARNKAAKARREARELENKIKNQFEKDAVLAKTYGIDLDLLNPELWQSGLEKNADAYGRCIYEYAETWAKLMQAEISQGKQLTDVAGPTSFEMGYLGISGFMYGAAVSILTQCWQHGEALRQWHNGKYNHSGDGVVNPAILTLSPK